MGAELVGEPRPGGRPGPCGPGRLRRSATVAGAVGDQRPQPGPVGAQGVGQHERVEPVVLVAGRAVAAAQVLDLVRADHHHGDPGVEQGVDDRAVGALDRDLADAVPAQRRDQVTQTGGGVFDGEPVDLAAAASTIDDGVVVAGPVEPAGHVVGGYSGRGRVLLADFIVSLLAASPSGEAPLCGAGTRLPVRSLFGAHAGAQPCRRSARPGEPPGPADLMRGRRPRQASRAVTQRHLGCISNPSKTTDTDDGAPVSERTRSGSHVSGLRRRSRSATNDSAPRARVRAQHKKNG